MAGFIKLLGIISTIIGIFFIIFSLSLGIVSFSTNLYSDIYTFDAKFSNNETGHQTPFFHLEKGSDYSIWLKMKNRAIENKDFEIKTSVVDKSGKVIFEGKENFRFGYFRNSDGNAQYYHIGKLKNITSSYVKINYEKNGEYNLISDGEIAIRKGMEMNIPYKEIFTFLISLLLIILGIILIVKSK